MMPDQTRSDLSPRRLPDRRLGASPSRWGARWCAGDAAPLPTYRADLKRTSGLAKAFQIKP